MEGIKREIDERQPFVYKICIKCANRILVSLDQKVEEVHTC